MSVFLAEVPGEEQHRKCFFNVPFFYNVCDNHLISTFRTFKASKDMCPPVHWDRMKRQRQRGHYRVDSGLTVRDSPPGLARRQAMVLTRRLQVWLLPSGQGQTKRQAMHTLERSWSSASLLTLIPWNNSLRSNIGWELTGMKFGISPRIIPARAHTIDTVGGVSKTTREAVLSVTLR